MGSWYNIVGRENPCITTCGAKPIEPVITDFVPAGTAPTPSKMTQFVTALGLYRQNKAKWDECNQTCIRTLSMNAPTLSTNAPARTDGASSHDTAELVPLGVGTEKKGISALSTGTKIGIGVGIVAIVAVIYFMRKGKK
jgi:hypothetical protein